jgi:hypothetical protein
MSIATGFPMKKITIPVLNALAAATVHAAETPRVLRDPMQPPALARATAAPTADTPASMPLAARHLLVVEGRRYVMEGSRRRGVGDLLGDARIERIEDAAVIVRSAGGSQRLPLFGGVTKQAASEPPAVTAVRPDRLSGSGDKP